MSINPETLLQRKIMVALSELGAVPYRMHVGQFYTPQATPIYVGIPGTPDLLIIAPRGITLWYELKTKNGKLREDQVKFANLLKSMDHKCYEIRSVEQATTIYKEVINNAEK